MTDFKPGDIVLATKGNAIVQGEVYDSYGVLAVRGVERSLNLLIANGYTIELVSQAPEPEPEPELSENEKLIASLPPMSLVQYDVSADNSPVFMLLPNGKLVNVLREGGVEHEPLAFSRVKGLRVVHDPSKQQGNLSDKLPIGTVIKLHDSWARGNPYRVRRHADKRWQSPTSENWGNSYDNDEFEVIYQPKGAS
jgi:hypothetical protein